MSWLMLLDYLTTLRERKTWILAALMLYAVGSVPVLLANPPPHVVGAIHAWFGDADAFTLFMYLWIDVAMNKVVLFGSVVLASGVVLRERDTGVLPILLSKPLSASRYFVVRTVSVCAVMATLHALTQLAGAVWFSVRVEGFRVGTFLAAMSLHLFAAVFTTALCATLAVWIGRRGPAVLVSLGVLSTMVGLALIGFYQPAWRAWSLLDPVTLGALSLGHLDALDAGVLIPPMLALTVLTVLTALVGALRVRRLEV